MRKAETSRGTEARAAHGASATTLLLLAVHEALARGLTVCCSALRLVPQEAEGSSAAGGEGGEGGAEPAYRAKTWIHSVFEGVLTSETRCM